MGPKEISEMATTSAATAQQSSFTNQILHGDCIEVMHQMPANSVDFILTDPPYLVNYRDRTGRTIQNDADDTWLKPAMAEAYRVLKQDRVAIMFYGWTKVDQFFAAWKDAGFQPVGHIVFRKAYSSKSRFLPGAGVYGTRFGLLSTNTVNGNVPRNLGTMPSRIHLDSNLSRAFLLDPKDKDHPRMLTFNARSANLINHTNVTAVGTIVSSSTFGQSLSAEAARRVELGARFTF
jgi:DNA methylase